MRSLNIDICNGSAELKTLGISTVILSQNEVVKNCNDDGGRLHRKLFCFALLREITYHRVSDFRCRALYHYSIFNIVDNCGETNYKNEFCL